MELRHLRYFCAVAERRSFTMAARHLNVSQSGVSGQVRSLEDEIGVRLLRRNQRDVALTPGGMAFWQEAREILAQADRAVELAARASKGESGKLTVGLCGPVTSTFLPKIIRDFRRQFPAVSVSLKDRAPAEQVGALLDREIDISFSRSVPAELRPMLEHELLFREPVIAAIPKGHPAAAEEAVSARHLAAERIILFDRDGAPEVFDAIIAMCKKRKFSPKVGDTPRSWQSVLTMVEAGEGVALVPECVQHLRADDVVFRPVEGEPCLLDAIMAWRRHEPSALIERFLALVRARRGTPGPIRNRARL
jgi:DNA-binding transcriptional LysR family regulator